ncbi:hypothetical protein D3C76_1553150 [compost metagenome]
MAAEIPALVTSNMPVTTPIQPSRSSSVSAPCTREFPKLVIGTLAPAPANFTSGSYMPKASAAAPATTSVLMVWAGVSASTSINNWPMTQMAPPTRKAHK